MGSKIAAAICFFKGHKWCFWGLFDHRGSCQFEKCSRCGKYKGDGEKTRKAYTGESNV